MTVIITPPRRRKHYTSIGFAKEITAYLQHHGKFDDYAFYAYDGVDGETRAAEHYAQWLTEGHLVEIVAFNTKPRNVVRVHRPRR